MATKQKVEGKTEQAAEVGASTKQLPRAEMVRQAILEAHKAIETNYIALAQLLSEAYHKEFYTEWGFKDFREYCETELDIHYRKAMYLVDIWDKVKSLGLSKAKVAKLGWTKMKDIASVVTAENQAEWLEKADKMTSRELTEAVQVSRKADTSQAGPVPTITTMTFRLSEAEANIITEALEEAKKLTETDNAVMALEIICQDWLEQKGISPTRTNLDDRVKFLEAAYGVDITWHPKCAAEETPEEKEEKKDTKARKTEAKADKKAAARKEKDKAAPEPEEEAPTGQGQDINSLLGIGE